MISKQQVNLRLPNGDTFNGILNQTGSGFQEGQYSFVNDDVYTGSYEFGMRNGYGTYKYTKTG